MGGFSARRLAAACVVIVSVLGAGCGTDDSAEPGIDVVATTTVLGDLVRNVVADDARVEVLMPVGVNPHDFVASSQQVAAIHAADLVVASGLDLEHGLTDVLEAAVADGVPVWWVGPDVDPLPLDGGDREEAEGDDDHLDPHSWLDPHFWLDPLRSARAAILLADHLGAAAPDVEWGSRATAYAEELQRVHDESALLLSAVPQTDRNLVTNHGSLGYFADRYGFEVIGTVIPGGATLANPSSAEMAALVEAIRREQAPAVFTETIEPDLLARAIAAEVGYDVAVVELYTGSLGEPGTEGGTLVGMLSANARRIAAALGESPPES